MVPYRTDIRFRSWLREDGHLRPRLRELAPQCLRFGYRRLDILLLWNDITINHVNTSAALPWQRFDGT